MATAYQLGEETEHRLEVEAMAILQGKVEAPDPRYCKAQQDFCRQHGFEYALALWSRIRFMWLKSVGRIEVSSW